MQYCVSRKCETEVKYALLKSLIVYFILQDYLIALEKCIHFFIKIFFMLLQGCMA